jgi:Uma2 family endonuclease
MARQDMARKPATYEDLLKVPEHLVAELANGDLYATPRPAVRHARAASVLGSELTVAFDRGRGGPGGWWILDEPELHLQDDVLVPDLAGWRRARVAALPDTAAIAIAPDWACEVISPATEALDRGKKLPIYAREGVSHAWVINPASRTVEVMVLERGRWMLQATHLGNAVVRAEPFADLELDLGALWL